MGGEGPVWGPGFGGRVFGLGRGLGLCELLLISLFILVCLDAVKDCTMDFFVGVWRRKDDQSLKSAEKAVGLVTMVDFVVSLFYIIYILFICLFVC